MAVFDMAQSVVSPGRLVLSVPMRPLTISEVLADMEPRLMEMDLGR